MAPSRASRTVHFVRAFAVATYLYFMLWLAVAVVAFALLGGFDPVLIRSGSMSPLIRPGDVVLIQPVAEDGAAGLGPGTVITFADMTLGRDRLVTHRIFAVSADGLYITKGDANAGPDSDAVDPGDVIGVGRIVVPLVGLPAYWSMHGQWVPFLLWLASTVVALRVVSSSRRRRVPPRGRSSRRSEVAPEGPRSRVGAAGAPAGRWYLRLAIVVSLVSVAAVFTTSSNAALNASTASAGNTITAVQWKAVIGLDGGESHACLARGEGLVWCWGRNDKGQLGDGSTTDHATPVDVVGSGGSGLLSGVAALASGGKFNCAADTDGSVWCWGENGDGQLGDSTKTNRSVPVQVRGPGGSGMLSGVVDVAAGESHSCAVKGDGSVWCWGRNDKGQLGNASTTDSLVPVQVSGQGGSGVLSGVVEVAAGSKHVCAVTSGGSVWCWGENGHGQLGDSTTTNRSVPVQVRGPGGSGMLSGVVEVAAGESHSCAVKGDGSVWCWGRNDKGQLGNASTTDSLVPVQVSGQGGSGVLSGVVEVAAGSKHVCAVTSGGSVWCWGLNDKGQLGDTTTTNATSPVQVAGPGGTGTLTAAMGVDSGESHTCAVTTDATVWCWGRNDKGQLGDNTTTARATPVHVVGSGGSGTLTGVASLALGAKHSCVVETAGSAWCWGENGRGQLGDGTTTKRPAPTQVVGAGGVGSFTGAAAIAAGEEHTCVARSAGSAWCWGENGEGQLGDGSKSNSSSPRQVL